MTMQTKDSNWVYVVAFGSGNPEDCNIAWIDIFKEYNKFFRPIGGNRRAKEQLNYMAFRYKGKL